ncbi:legumain [Schistosoma bovis]|uniref:Hemoglobinase n=1 Tax=Schistosoma bovis TaxID=6184 RepID=A0A430Q3I3_SCHBO|nr:legumain [Schistosoma bovis]
MLRFSIFLIHCLFIVFVQSRFNSTIEYFDENLSDKNKWAILVAGSNGFYNYRHQADVCHAYHVLRSKGIKPEHIITMMYDDIAHNKMNPFRGKIFNDYSHRDWYKGVVIDYKGNNVNSETFLKVLKGDKSAGGKVLKSGKNDDVFIYFTDHGAPGLIAFPDDELYAKRFMATLKYLHRHKRYSRLVIYIEACESGSMFQGLLPSNLNIYATTAASPTESSYATFCDDPKIATCLADLYSYDWIVDSQTNMGKLHVGEFQGSRNKDSPENDEPPMKPKDFVASRDIPLYTLHRQIMMTNNAEDKNLLMEILGLKLKRRDFIEDTMKLIVKVMNSEKKPISKATIDQTLDCTESVYEQFKSKCFTLQQRRDLIEDTMKLVVKVMNNEKKPIAKATIDQTLDCTESVYEQFKSKCFTLQQRRDLIEDTMKLVVKVMNNEKKPIAKATIDQTLDCTESVYEQFKSKCFTLQQAPEVGGHLSTLYNYCAEGYTAETINEAIIKVCN